MVVVAVAIAVAFPLAVVWPAVLAGAFGLVAGAFAAAVFLARVAAASALLLAAAALLAAEAAFSLALATAASFAAFGFAFAAASVAGRRRRGDRLRCVGASNVSRRLEQAESGRRPLCMPLAHFLRLDTEDKTAWRRCGDVTAAQDTKYRIPNPVCITGTSRSP